jgi:hypothetical protein
MVSKGEMKWQEREKIVQLFPHEMIQKSCGEAKEKYHSKGKMKRNLDGLQTSGFT